MNTISLDTVHVSARPILARYAQELIRIYPDDIESIVVYGSATGPDFAPCVSYINTAVVLKEVSVPVLKRSLALIRWGMRKKIAAPLFLTKHHIETSKDVFPIEFLEMQENHAVLWGKDFFRDMQISQQYVRLSCESQIKSKLIRIRQAYLEVGFDRTHVSTIVKDALNSLMPVLRALCRMRQKPSRRTKEEIVRAVAGDFSLDGDFLAAIVREKKERQRAPSVDIDAYLARFLAQLQILADKVDQL